MRIGISNLAFPPEYDDAVATLLNRHGIDTIDLAPSRYAGGPGTLSLDDWRAVAARWRRRDIHITGLQSLLHGVPGLALFGERDARQRLGERLLSMMDVAVAVGAKVLVFGAWQQRVRGALPLAAAMDQAAELFRPLSRAAAERGLVLTIEPIFAGYGNDFLVDHDEALTLVKQIGEPGFGLTLDVGCLGLAGESAVAVLARSAAHIAHVQLAERDLAPLDPENPWHARVGPTLRDALPARVACIEALPPDGSSPVAAVERSLMVALSHYR